MRSEELRDSERRAKRLTKKTTAKLRRFEVNFSLCGFEGAKREEGSKRSKSEPNASEANGSRAKQLTERAEKAVREGSQTGKIRQEARRAQTLYNSGDDSKREPPVPIPNTEVKPLSAEGTWLATAREIRTPLDPIKAEA